jgi:hypothetical protein
MEFLESDREPALRVSCIETEMVLDRELDYGVNDSGMKIIVFGIVVATIGDVGYCSLRLGVCGDIREVPE